MLEPSTDHYLREVIRLADELIQIAYQGDAERVDVGCGVVFGSVRDRAYKVKRLAAEELQRHRQRPGPGATGKGARDPGARGE